MSLLEVKNLHTYFDTRRGIVKAVDGISFTLEKGETLGIVGESGSGKSQTAMSILRLFEPNQYIHEGQIFFEGVEISKLPDKDLLHIRGNSISMIFQEPMSSLNPVFTVKKQMNEVLKLHQGMTEEEATKKSYEMLKAVKIENPDRVLRSYPFQLSGGMSQRVMIAMALACNPKILIADEPTTALDVIIQAEILKLMNDLKKDFETAIMFITHDLGVIANMADRVIVMHGGKIVESAPIKTIFTKPYHPYTKRLLAAFLKTDIRSKESRARVEKEFYSAENEHFTFEHFKNHGGADPDWVEVGEKHYVAVTLKK
jgi:peptide/nickel transport system ATP-binding protein